MMVLLVRLAIWLVVSVILLAPAFAQAQATAQTPAPSNRLRVFLECGDCFSTYLRDEIEWVDFLRDPNGAFESLRCSTCSRSRPIVSAKRAHTPS